MFDKVFIEKDSHQKESALSILNKVKYNTLIEIDDISKHWGTYKKPYLHKRTNLNLYIGEKKGTLVKEAPPAYGHGTEKHYYFIHAYNCIYECQYCYLQGHFNSPDIVLFINHEDIVKEMEELCSLEENKDAWFHAGEFSDSLALSHITNELEVYFDFFKRYPQTKLELRTKSSNIMPLLKLEPLKNVFVSFTLSSHEAGKAFDYRCPSVRSRLTSIKKLVEHGFNIGIHFDPIIYHPNFEQDYEKLLTELASILPSEQLGYISIGVVRFTKDVYKEVENNYPDSPITKQDYIKSFDNKVRYNLAMRMWILNTVKNICIKNEYEESKIYLCMEDQ